MSNILIISNYFPPEMGAASNRIFNLSKVLSCQNRNPIVICPIPNYPLGRAYNNYSKKFFTIENIDGIKLYRPRIFSSNSKNSIFRLFSMFSFIFWLILLIPILVFKYRIRNIIIQSPPLLVGYVSVIISKIMNRQIILNISDVWPLSALEIGEIKNGVLYRILCRLEKQMYYKSNKIICQSNEIINHVKSNSPNVPTFLYRNLSNEKIEFKLTKNSKLRIIYAGLLGHAQGVLNLLKNIDFNNLDVQLDIYGDGFERKMIVEEIVGKKNITYFGKLDKEQLIKKMAQYDLSLIPLKKSIYGAVPSKIYESINNFVPILFLGNVVSEPAKIIDKNKIGICIDYNNYNCIFENLEFLSKNMNIISDWKNNIRKTKDENFNFELQSNNFLKFLNS